MVSLNALTTWNSDAHNGNEALVIALIIHLKILPIWFWISTHSNSKICNVNDLPILDHTSSFDTESVNS